MAFWVGFMEDGLCKGLLIQDYRLVGSVLACVWVAVCEGGCVGGI